MELQKFLKRKSGQSAMEYVIVSAVLAAIFLAAFYNFTPDSFFLKAKSQVDETFNGLANDLLHPMN